MKIFLAIVGFILLLLVTYVLLEGPANAQTTHDQMILFADSNCPGLLFSEEGNKDTNQWTLGGGGPLSDGNNAFLSQQLDTPNAAVAPTSAGMKVSVLPANAPNGAHWIAGLMSTRNTFSHTYGYWEAIATISPGMLQPGMSFAFWMLGYHTPPGASWPQETDIAEFYWSTRDGAVHNASNGDTAANWDYNVQPGVHTFGLEWQPPPNGRMRWYMDSQLKADVPTPPNFNEPMFIILGAAATKGDNGWTKPPTSPDATGSVTFNRVRVYESMAAAKACVPNVSAPSVSTAPPTASLPMAIKSSPINPTTMTMTPPVTTATDNIVVPGPDPTSLLTVSPTPTAAQIPPAPPITTLVTASPAATTPPTAPIAPLSTPSTALSPMPTTQPSLLQSALTAAGPMTLSPTELALIQEFEALDRQSQSDVSKVLQLLQNQ